MASIVHTPMHVGQVTVEGMLINIPPKEERGQAATASPIVSRDDIARGGRRE